MVKRISRIRFLVHNKTLLKTLFYHFKKNKSEDDPLLITKKRAKAIFNYKFNFENPRSFNEWLCWLKFNYRDELWERCADKLGSKKFLESIGLSDYLPITYGVYKTSKDINLNVLPNKFVLKTNHDCGTVFVCEKGKTDFAYIFNLLDKSLEKKYDTNNFEWVYEHVNPVIFAEEYLEPACGNELIDYKFFMFRDSFAFGFTGQNRYEDCRFTLFDKNFNDIPCEYIYLNPKKNEWPKKPLCFDEMMDISKKIGLYFKFVRVDMYWTNKGLKIGELTFFSQSGLGPFTKKKYDYMFGYFFKLENFHAKNY